MGKPWTFLEDHRGSEVEDRGEEKAAETGEEGRGHRAVGDELRIDRCDACGSAGGGAHDAAESHGRLRIIDGEWFGNEWSDNHDEDGFHNASRNGNGDDFRGRTESRAGDRSDDEGRNACPDGDHIDHTGVAERIRNSDACDEADEFTDEEGCDTSPAHLFDLAKIRAKSGGNLAASY